MAGTYEKRVRNTVPPVFALLLFVTADLLCRAPREPVELAPTFTEGSLHSATFSGDKKRMYQHTSFNRVSMNRWAARIFVCSRYFDILCI